MNGMQWKIIDKERPLFFEYNQIEHENTPSYGCSQKFSNVVSKPTIECHVRFKLTFKWLRQILTIYVLVFQMNIKFHISFLGNKSWLCYIPLQDHFNELTIILFGKYSFPNIDPKIQNFVGILIFKLGMQLENTSLFWNIFIFIWTSVCS